MAKNLQAKLPPSDTIRVFDINKAAVEKLVHAMKTQQAGGAVAEAADSAGDAARDAVCAFLFPCRLAPRCGSYLLGFYDEFVLFMTCSKLGRLAGLRRDYCYTTKANPLRSPRTTLAFTRELRK
jgi:hypothetical protein